MGLLDLFKKRAKEEQPPAQDESEWNAGIYSGMRVEVTAMDGRMLFVAKLMRLWGNTAQLQQLSDSALSRETEPVHVRIRGYNDYERKAVYMEGTISPESNYLWHVEQLIVARLGNDRAFFRLSTNLEATATTFRGLSAGEKPCRVLNVSVGGACVSSEHRYHEGDKFLLKVRLLEEGETSAVFCQILRVVEKGPSQFEYGCKFLELNDTDQARITQNIFAAQRKQRGKS